MTSRLPRQSHTSKPAYENLMSDEPIRDSTIVNGDMVADQAERPNGLLPCPFCDNQPAFSCVEEKDERRYVAMRLDCWCGVEMKETLSFGQYRNLTGKQIEYDLKSKLTKRWNIRALPSPSGDSAEGETKWRLLPVEPTEAMIEAGVKDHRHEQSFAGAEETYLAMVAAAPAIPKHAPDAAKPTCETCGGTGLIGGFEPPDGHRDDPCPGCNPASAIPKPAPDAVRLPDFEEPRVQIVYEMLCDDTLNRPPNPEEHWEGWIARNIVAALTTPAPSPDARAFDDAVPGAAEPDVWQSLRKTVEDSRYSNEAIGIYVRHHWHSLATLPVRGDREAIRERIIQRTHALLSPDFVPEIVDSFVNDLFAVLSLPVQFGAGERSQLVDLNIKRMNALIETARPKNRWEQEAKAEMEKAVAALNEVN